METFESGGARHHPPAAAAIAAAAGAGSGAAAGEYAARRRPWIAGRGGRSRGRAWGAKRGIPSPPRDGWPSPDLLPAEGRAVGPVSTAAGGQAPRVQGHDVEAISHGGGGGGGASPSASGRRRCRRRHAGNAASQRGAAVKTSEPPATVGRVLWTRAARAGGGRGFAAAVRLCRRSLRLAGRPDGGVGDEPTRTPSRANDIATRLPPGQSQARLRLPLAAANITVTQQATGMPPPGPPNLILQVRRCRRAFESSSCLV